ncbi:MAG: YhfC family intramembrane metalloprotease [Bacteroidales bacterium]|nr:YhfC family intramembrane metalloprotease [Bacteroidales bacterium]
MVPAGTIIMLVLDVILGIGIPVCLAWWAVKKHDTKLSTILIGAATFIVAALVLESIVHKLVLTGARGTAIMGNMWYYALYGGLMAGLFEETGRFLAMKFFMKKEASSTKSGVAYGLGHGGIEMMLLFGLSMISSLSMAIMINSGQVDTLFSQAPGGAQELMAAQIDQLKSASAGEYLYGLWERFSAIILQVSLSILVWAAVRKGGKWLWLFPAAILLHALVDGVAVIMSKSLGMFAVELIITVMAVAISLLAWLVARKAFPTTAPAPDAVQPEELQ